MSDSDVFNLDDLYTLMDALKAEIQANAYVDSEFGDAPQPELVTSYEFRELYEILSLMLGGGVVYGTDVPRALGVRPELIQKFYRRREPIPRADAFKLADRTLTYLRSIEGRFVAGEAKGEAAPRVTPPMPPVVTPPAPVLAPIPATLWQPVPDVLTLKQKITKLAELLEEFIAAAKGSNLPAGQGALTEIERAQLIALLETALRLLGAPLVEKSLFKKAREALKKVVAKTAEKEVEEGLGKLADGVQDALGDVISSLFTGG